MISLKSAYTLDLAFGLMMLEMLQVQEHHYTIILPSHDVGPINLFEVLRKEDFNDEANLNV